MLVPWGQKATWAARVSSDGSGNPGVRTARCRWQVRLWTKQQWCWNLGDRRHPRRFQEKTPSCPVKLLEKLLDFQRNWFAVWIGRFLIFSGGILFGKRIWDMQMTVGGTLDHATIKIQFEIIIELSCYTTKSFTVRRMHSSLPFLGSRTTPPAELRGAEGDLACPWLTGILFQPLCPLSPPSPL